MPRRSTGYGRRDTPKGDDVLRRAMVWAAPLLAGYVWKRMRGGRRR